MEKYIGTKQIEAKPMTMGEAYEHGFLQAGRVPKESEKANEGYMVKYSDGYVSWSPKKPFDDAYRKAETFLDRLHIEFTDLFDKTGKLAAFLDSGKLEEVVKDELERVELRLQFNLMKKYLSVLHARIEKAEKEESSHDQYSFGEAIEILKMGYAIRRRGWNGKGMFVIKHTPTWIGSETIPHMTSLSDKAKDLILRSTGEIKYRNQCLIFNENTGYADSWVPSSSDMFANDWEIVL